MLNKHEGTRWNSLRTARKRARISAKRRAICGSCRSLPDYCTYCSFQIDRFTLDVYFDESPALFIPSTLFLPLDSRHYHYRDPKNYKIILRRKRKINETKLKYQKTSAVLCYESNFSTYFIHSLQKYNRIHFSERSLKIRSSFAQQL